MSVRAQAGDGRWVPAIPLPYEGLRKGCHCGQRFWTTEGYRAHYVLVHILWSGEPSPGGEAAREAPTNDLREPGPEETP